MAKQKLWTDEEVSQAIEMRRNGRTVHEIASALDRSFGSTEFKLKSLRNEMAKEFHSKVEQAALNPPVETDLRAILHEKEKEIARLRQQLTWAQHADCETRTGGTMSIRESDVHHGDENHMLSCWASVHEKLKELIRQYEPNRLNYIGFDDFVCGSGIYKEQDLQSAVSDPEAQMHVAAMKARKMLLGFREVTDAPIQIEWMRGNHEYAKGQSIAEAMFYMTRATIEDIPNVSMRMHWDCAVLNLADKGTYNVMVMHGFGHSNNAPNSPQFVSAVKEKIIMLQRKLPPGDHIRRVLSGHTHWRSVGLERIVDLPFDTTGGYQRNTRVKLGMNQRPIGSIVYVSPEGQDGNILNPIEVSPDLDTQEREVSDPQLPAMNRQDCGECLRKYHEFVKAKGLHADYSELGLVTQGRW